MGYLDGLSPNDLCDVLNQLQTLKSRWQCCRKALVASV